jgi:oligoendopeptidase F
MTDLQETAAPQATGAEHVVWDLSIFYAGADDPRIAADMDAVLARAQAFAETYRGRIASLSAAELVEAVQALEAIYDANGRIQTYASLEFSTDSANPVLGALMQRMQEHSAKVSQHTLFFDLEWKAVDDAHAHAILSETDTLGKYRHMLEAERRYRPFTLSEVEEQLLVEKSVTGRSAWERFFTQLMGSLRYPFDGEMLTQSKILNKMFDPDRDVRSRAAQAVTETLRSRTMELTYIFNVLAADKAQEDARRQYPSWISARNLSNKAPDAVVEALIGAVTESYDIVARHYRLKRALLGYDALYDYDRYAPLPVADAGRQYSWEEARSIVVDAYRAFSPRMGELADRFFTANWIHAAPMPNKRGGAFASPSVPSAHPFVFVNYLGKARDVMTLAHELGHGIHMALSGEAQGITGLYTPLTTAEMASVFGEMLVFTDLMRKEPDAETRLSLLMHRVEDSFSTIYRQVSMNRFEHAMHTARREEGELSSERLSALWMEAQRPMYSDSVTLREEYAIWWSYIPHFLHTPGYVYAYAFGELLVLALFNLYQKQGAGFAPEYEAVLAAGDSDYPENILARVGVDLGDPAFWNEGIAAVRAMVEEEEALARSLYPDRF